MPLSVVYVKKRMSRDVVCARLSAPNHAKQNIMENLPNIVRQLHQWYNIRKGKYTVTILFGKRKSQ